MLPKQYAAHENVRTRMDARTSCFAWAIPAEVDVQKTNVRLIEELPKLGAGKMLPPPCVRIARIKAHCQSLGILSFGWYKSRQS